MDSPILTHIFQYLTYPQVKTAILKFTSSQKNNILIKLQDTISTYEKITSDEQELKEALFQEIINMMQTITVQSAEHIGFYLNLIVGQGGQDAEDCTNLIHNMYLTFITKTQVKFELIDISPTDVGTSSSLFKIQDPSALLIFQQEQGVHRVERQSPFQKGAIHTSEVNVLIYPAYATPQIKINLKEIKLTPIRSGGPGGQHANKNYTGVRLVHVPTGLTVQVTKYRSLYQNKQTALTILADKLRAASQKGGSPKGQELTKLTIVKTYDFTRDQLKLHPHKIKLSNLKKIIKGNLELPLLYNILYAISQRRTTYKDLSEQT